MDFIDYYKTLEIDQKATSEEIKKAYRKLARKHHPDLNSKNEQAKVNFQRINEANSVLSDPEKRKKYDKYGKDWKHSEEFEKAKQYQASGQNQSKRQTRGGQSTADFSDFFESMFGGASGSGRQVK